MCDQTEILYLDGDVVWVKLGSTWWPGEVLGSDRTPQEVLASLRKAPIAVVKFFREESLELVKNINNIYKYNCSRKHEFIKKGIDQFRSKHAHMELFPEYVREAEERTHGDPHILEAPEYQPPQKVDYAGLFGSRKTPGSPSKQKVKSMSPSGSEYTPNITHPRILQKMLKGTSDYKAHILVQETTPRQEEEGHGIAVTPAPASGHFSCHACPFSCTRINVMVLHNRCHSGGYVPYTPPKRHKPRPPPGSGKAKTPRVRGRPRAPRRLPAAPAGAPPGPVSQSAMDAEPLKSELEIKNSLLADWSEDSDESMDILSALKLSARDDCSDTEQTRSKDEEKENSLNMDNESPKLEDKKVGGPLSGDVFKKSHERKVGSCFDFDDDDDEQMPIETIGRKIPRLSTKSDEGSRKMLDMSADPAEETQAGEEDSLSNNLAVDLNLDAEINSLLQETAVPTLPALPTLPMDPKFTEKSESPLKKSAAMETEKAQTKSIFKTKTFFRSRHTRSQDAIEKYVADNTSVDKPPTYMEEPPEPDNAVPLPRVPDILYTTTPTTTPIPEVKVPKFAPKIQLKKMKAALGEKVKSFITPPPELRKADPPVKHNRDEVIPTHTVVSPLVDSHLALPTADNLKAEDQTSVKQHTLEDAQNVTEDSQINTADLPTGEVAHTKDEPHITNNDPCIEETGHPIDESVPINDPPIEQMEIEHAKEESININDLPIDEVVHAKGESFTTNNPPIEELEHESLTINNLPIDEVVHAKGESKTTNDLPNEEVVHAKDESFNINDLPTEEVVVHAKYESINDLPIEVVHAKEESLIMNDLPVEELVQAKGESKTINDLPIEKVLHAKHESKTTNDLPIEESLCVKDQSKTTNKLTIEEVLHDKDESISTNDLPIEEIEHAKDASMTITDRPIEKMEIEHPIDEPLNINDHLIEEEVHAENDSIPAYDHSTEEMEPTKESITTYDPPIGEIEHTMEEPVTEEQLNPSDFPTEPIEQSVSAEVEKPSVHNIITNDHSIEEHIMENSVIEEVEQTPHHVPVIQQEKTVTKGMCKALPEFEVQDRWNNESVDNLLKSSTEENVVAKTCTVNDLLGTMEENQAEFVKEQVPAGPTESDLQIAETLITLPITGAPVHMKLLDIDQNFSAAKSLVQMSEALQGDQLSAAAPSHPTIPPLSLARSPKKTVSLPLKNTPVEHSKLFQILDEPVKQKSPVKIIQNKPILGREKILNFQSRAPPHKPRVIIRRSGASRAPSLLPPMPTPVPLPAPTPASSIADEEAFFDINSMPIVLSEEMLTPENLDKMPIVLSEGPSASAPPQCKMKVIANVKDSTGPKKEKPKALIRSSYDKITLPIKNYGQESKMNALLKPIMEKSASPNILSKSPKVRATKHLLVVDKTTGEQKIISTKMEEPLLAPSKAVKSSPAPSTAPTLLSAQPKGEKFIILPPGASHSGGGRTQKIIVNPQTGKSQIIFEDGQGKMKASTAKIIQNRSSTDATGNTVMILTNAQGVQSKIVLTPEHQRILFPKKGTGPVVTSHTVLSPRSRAAVTSQSIITSRGQLLSPISGNALITSTGQLLPPRGPRTVLTAKPNQTILTSRGQLITTQSSPVTSQATSRAPPATALSRAPKQGLLRTTAQPQMFIKSSTGKLVSTDPASILQGKKPGTVMHLTAAQFEHLQKTGQIITSQQPSLTQIISPSQLKASPGKVQQKFILQKYASASNSKQSPQVVPKQVDKKVEAASVKRKALPSLVPSQSVQSAPPPLKKQKLRELLTTKVELSPPPKKPPSAQPQPIMDLGNLDDLIPATTISTCKGETRISHALQGTHSVLGHTSSSSKAANQRNSQVLSRVTKPLEIPVPEPEPEPPAAPPAVEEAPPGLAAEGQLLAVPGENFGGPPNSFYLCMEENGTLTPIDNQPLVLENNQLVPMVLPPPVPEQRVILNAGEQQILVDQQTLLSLLGGEARGAEGQQLLLQGDVRQLLAALAPQQAPHTQDILAAALADTGDSLLMEMDSLGPDFHSLSTGMSASSIVSETSTTLKPIMSASEQPSKKGGVGRLPPAARLEDTLAVIGVTPPSVPTSLDLPITVTDPRIAPKVCKPPSQALPPLDDTTHTTSSLLTRVSQSNRPQSHQPLRRLPPASKLPASSMPCLDDSSSDSFASENPQLLPEAIQTKIYSPISMPLLTEDTSEEPLTGVKSMPVLMDSDDSALRCQSEESQESRFTEEVSLPSVPVTEETENTTTPKVTSVENEVGTSLHEHDGDYSAMGYEGASDMKERVVPETAELVVSKIEELSVLETSEHSLSEGHGISNEITQHSELNISEHEHVPDVTEHDESQLGEGEGVSCLVHHNESEIVEQSISSINEDGLMDETTNNESAMVEHGMPELTGQEPEHDNAVSNHLTEQKEAELVEECKSDFVDGQGYLSDINQGGEHPVIAENGNAMHLDIAPSSVPSSACSSPDVLPPQDHFSDSSSSSSLEIPIQPSICVSQQRLAGLKRSASPTAPLDSRDPDSPQASPKRFNFNHER